jgi:hypothetical protein
MSLWGHGRRRTTVALSALLVCAALLVTASVAFASARIEGVVTDAIPGPEFGEPVAHVKVTAYDASTGDVASEGSPETTPFGTYELMVPTGGEYLVGFRTNTLLPADFAPQYYLGQTRLSKATHVKVAEGATATGIDAKLTEGASISGTVTDAGTHQPIPGIVVLAESESEPEAFSLAITSSSGEYTIKGLGSGTDRVAFVQEGIKEGSTETPPMYMSQIFSDEPLLEGSFDTEELLIVGTPIVVSVPSTTPGIDAALVRNEAVNTSAPVASGTPALGQTLSCASGTWTGLASLAYAYQWLRDGSAIAGANASTYTVQAADQGDVLSCEVTATNKLGGATATSSPLTVPAAVVVADLTPPPPPRLTLSSTRIAASTSGVARVAISCQGQACSGSLELTAQTLSRLHVGHKTVSKKETVDLGKVAYTLAAGHSQTIVIHLTSVGRQLLERATHHRLAADVLVLLDGGKSTRAVTLSESVAAKHK